VALDAAGHARVERVNGDLLLNAGPTSWETSRGQALAPGECRFVAAQGMGGPRPLSTAPRAELYRLLAGQLSIIAREVAFKGRNLDSRRFLGAEEIALEDHSNW
jgi:hypothetical protein